MELWLFSENKIFSGLRKLKSLMPFYSRKTRAFRISMNNTVNYFSFSSLWFAIKSLRLP